MSSTMKSISGVVLGCAYRAQQFVVGMAWHHGPRPRPEAFPTLDPTQRPSAPLRWGT